MINARQAAFFAGLFFGLSLAPAMVAADDGQEKFVEHKCNKCHAVSSAEIKATAKSEKMHGPDLSEVDEQRDADWVKSYVLKEVKLNEKNHKGKWEGPKKDLEAISLWVASIESNG